SSRPDIEHREWHSSVGTVRSIKERNGALYTPEISAPLRVGIDSFVLAVPPRARNLARGNNRQPLCTLLPLVVFLNGKSGIVVARQFVSDVLRSLVERGWAKVYNSLL